jgi:preprotein translocase subunit SecF
MNITLIIALVSAIVSGIAGFALAWQLQTGNIAKLELEQKDERISIQRAARTTLERSMSQVAAAQAASANRNVRVRVDSDRAGNAGNGLRLASTSAVRAAEDFTDACRAVIAAYDTVVATGSGLLREVARAADQCDSDLQLIQEAWPKLNPKD